MKKRKIIQKLEERGIKTVEELIDALEEGVKIAQENIDKVGVDIDQLKQEIAFKQEKIENNFLIKEKGIEAIKILTGY